jgi:hypothetical protein
MRGRNTRKIVSMSSDATQRMKGLGKLAKYQHHNFAPSKLSSSFPSMIILFHPK